MNNSISSPRWLLVLPLLLALCCCTQPTEEPEDAGGTTDSANDVGEDADSDTSEVGSDAEEDLPTDAQIPESERFCDEDYAREQLDQEILPEPNSPCSCNGKRYSYAIGFCYGNILACVPLGWETQSFCIQDAGTPEEDVTGDASTDTNTDDEVDAHPDTE